MPPDKVYVEASLAEIERTVVFLHRYWEVDYRRVYQTLQSSLGDFAQFATAVLAFTA